MKMSKETKSLYELLLTLPEGERQIVYAGIRAMAAGRLNESNFHDRVHALMKRHWAGEEISPEELEFRN